MKLPRSTYYYQPRGRDRDDQAPLTARIEALCGEYPRYGYRRVTAQLGHEGWKVNHKRVARIMRERGLCVKPRRRWVRTTNSEHDNPIFPNLARDFTAEGPNELWVADITYIRIRATFVYLAVVLDACSRRVVGYAVSRHIDIRLTLAALQAAIEHRRPPPDCFDNWIFSSVQVY